jgi:hypothetical protein
MATTNRCAAYVDGTCINHGAVARLYVARVILSVIVAENNPGREAQRNQAHLVRHIVGCAHYPKQIELAHSPEVEKSTLSLLVHSQKIGDLAIQYESLL